MERHKEIFLRTFNDVSSGEDIWLNALSRKTDPETSKTAARKLVQSGAHQTACERVHAALVEFKQGANANELADATGMLVHVVLKRLPDLMKKGIAAKTDKVRENQTVWKAV